MSEDHGMTSGFDSQLDMHVDSCTGHEVVGHLRLGPQHQRESHGVRGVGVGVHGGVYSAVIEKLASLGAAAWLDGQGTAVGLSNTTNVVRPAAGGTLTLTARPLQQASSQQLWNVDVTNAEGDLIACGQVRLANVADARHLA